MLNLKVALNITIAAATASVLWVAPATALAAAPASSSTASAPSAQALNYDVAPGQTRFRNFYQVLEDLLGDFEFHLKSGNVTGLKDVSLRNMALSENVPPSFKSHLELSITEKILKSTKAKVIQCLPCKAKRATLSGENVVITSPEVNPQELSRIAQMSGIKGFLDIAFAYQPSGMVLSMFISDPDSGSILWSRSYNSETSRASAFRRGVDFTQIDDARKMTEYVPTLQYRLTTYYTYQPQAGSGLVGCLGLGFRMMERYDNRRKEVGFELDYFRDSSSIVTTLANAAQNLYGGLNATLLFMHAWNFIGEEENYNKARGSFFAGIGGTYASGYLGGLLRTGWEWRLAKRWAVSANVGYRPQGTLFIGSTSLPVTGGEFGIGISHIF